ncbi:MAG: SRPBCC family protein [Spirochaetes bacterium]|nr:SRPBCC family protein [Spirochaetota bacterium]MBU0954745.1 SRPBCC family protein [Spirochaetota bacterium]
MTYSTTIEIACPINTVFDAMESLEHSKKWQPGLIDWQLLEGEINSVGAKKNLIFSAGEKTSTMLETLEKRHKPDSLHYRYEAEGVVNINRNEFVPLSEAKTKWTQHNEFIFASFKMKLFAFFMPNVFRKQTFSSMQLFKAYLENLHS